MFLFYVFSCNCCNGHSHASHSHNYHTHDVANGENPTVMATNSLDYVDDEHLTYEKIMDINAVRNGPQPCDIHNQNEKVGDNYIPNQQLNLIPYPNELKLLEGNFVFNDETKVFTNLPKAEKKLFLSYISALDIPLISCHKPLDKNIVKLIVDSSFSIDDEYYELTVSSDVITITGQTSKGVFYGVQTLAQLIQLSSQPGNVQALEIKDKPAFKYRGYMIDVSRHFASKQVVLKQIDMLAYFKINFLHLHLTDNGGWRIEIKQYPELTDQTAYRPESRWRNWWLSGNKKYCPKDTPNAYGGYFTQEDCKEMIKYAQERFITIIPEVEMPGHSDEVFLPHPELTCSGKIYDGADFCIGNPETFVFVQNVLTEIMDLFPSEYIHIGGDEATMSRWGKCPKCQALYKEMGFSKLEELQSYFIKKIDAFITSKNRKMIGWDEILKGGLSPHAIVMSWTGEGNGAIAANAGHHVVMSPAGKAYLCYYQDWQPTQPEAPTWNFVNLETVYKYHPIPSNVDDEHKKYIWGVQGSLWTEWIPTADHLEYMTWPRMFAIAEIAWTQQELKNWDGFRQRIRPALRFIAEKGYTPYRYDLSIGDRQEHVLPVDHLARGKTVKYYQPYHPNYPAGGDGALTNGVRGNWQFWDGAWQGFQYGAAKAHTFDAEVDLGDVLPIKEVSLEWIQSTKDYVWFPKTFVIQVSNDQKTYRTISNQQFEFTDTGFCFTKRNWTGSESARYVRVQADPFKEKGGWIFTDEIVIQ